MHIIQISGGCGWDISLKTGTARKPRLIYERFSSNVVQQVTLQLLALPATIVLRRKPKHRLTTRLATSGRDHAQKVQEDGGTVCHEIPPSTGLLDNRLIHL